MKKKVISLLLALVLTFSLVPTTAFAAQYVTVSAEAKTVDGGYIVEPTEVELDENDTVYTLIAKVADVANPTGSYVTEIDGLAAGDYGYESGWMTLVNGSSAYPFPQLKDGDSVRFCYTYKTYGYDIELIDLVEELTKLVAQADEMAMLDNPFDESDEMPKYNAFLEIYGEAYEELGEITTNKDYIDALGTSLYGSGGKIGQLKSLIARLSCAMTGDEYIAATGATINAPAEIYDNGAYNLTATLTPENATDQSYTWAVMGITGSAYIDQNGGFYPSAAGMVIVQLWHNDASNGVLATKAITIKHMPTDMENAAASALDFYKTQYTLSDFWELGAASALGGDLYDFAIPQSTDILTSLMCGVTPDTTQITQGDDGALAPYLSNHIWNIISLDRAGADFDRESALSYLLSAQHDDGGFGWDVSQADSDLDTTAMAAIALAPYKNTYSDECTALVDYLKSAKSPSGGFLSTWGENANTTATVISGLVAMGESIDSDTQANLLSYQLPDGSFKYLASDTDSNAYATKQCAVAVADILSGSSYFLNLTKKSTRYIANTVSICNDGKIFTTPVTVKATDKYSKAITLAAKRGNITLGGYDCLTDGEKVNANTVTSENAFLYAVPTGTMAIGAFSLSDNSIVLSSSAEISFTVTDIVGTYDGSVEIFLDSASVGTADRENSLKITPTQTGTFTLSAVGDGIFVADTTLTVTPKSSGSSAAPISSSASITVKEQSGKIHLAKTSYTITSVTTVLELLRKCGLSVTEKDGYVSSIDSLAEFDRGSQSGWTYTVNGEYPNVAAGAYTLKNGDSVVWIYTDGEQTSTDGTVTDTDTPSQTVHPFNDTVNENAEKLAALGIIKGDGGSFRPDDILTRAELATIICTALSLKSSENPYTDVNEKDWYFESACAAYANGIILGTDIGFEGNSKVYADMLTAVLKRIKSDKIDTEKFISLIADIQGDITREIFVNLLFKCIK